MNKPNAIRVALSQEKAGAFTGWVAQCLDFDLVAQGETLETAQESFKRTFLGHVALSLHRGQTPFSGVLVKRPNQKLKERPAVDLRNLHFAYSQLENPRTVPVLE